MRVRGREIDKEKLEHEWQIRLYGKLLGLVVLIAFAIAFVLENRKTVHIHFVLFTAGVSLIWLILLSLLLGLGGGVLLSQLYRRRRTEKT